MNQITLARAKMVTALLLMAMLLLTGVRLYIENSYVTKGIVLGEYQDRNEKLRTENIILQDKVVKERSFAVIATKAAAMGFIERK